MALNKIIYLILLMTICLAADSAGGREFAVTQIAPTARALALGNAYAAHSPDAASFNWNPGTLAFNRKNEIATIQTQLATEVDFFGVSGVVPMAWCNVGFYWAQLQIADIPETAATLNNNEVEITGRLTYYENAAVLALGREILKNLGLGVNFRNVSQRISADYGYGTGWSGTLGLYWQALPGLAVGLVADNLNAYQKYDTGTLERLPQSYTVGLGWHLLDNLAWYYDYKRREDSTIAQDYTGLEFLITPRIRIAIGYMENRFTAGAGLALESVYFDYAYAAQNKNSLGSDQYISLGVKW